MSNTNLNYIQTYDYNTNRAYPLVGIGSIITIDASDNGSNYDNDADTRINKFNEYVKNIASGAIGTDNVGSNNKFIYLQEGKPVESNANIGNESTPVFLYNGEFKVCTDIKAGGSGNFTLEGATSDKLGGIKLGFQEDELNRLYPVLTENDRAYVRVPWTASATGGSNVEIAQGGQTIILKPDTETDLLSVMADGEIKKLSVKVEKSKATVTNTSNTLAYDTSVQIATVDGSAIYAKLPPAPKTEGGGLTDVEVRNTNYELSWNNSTTIAYVHEKPISVTLGSKPSASVDIQQNNKSLSWTTTKTIATINDNDISIAKLPSYLDDDKTLSPNFGGSDYVTFADGNRLTIKLPDAPSGGSNVTVEDGDSKLSWGQSTTLATITVGDNTCTINASLPNITDSSTWKTDPSTAKVYLAGKTSASSNNTSTGYVNASVYMQSGSVNAYDFVTTSDERLKTFKSDVSIDFNKIKEIPKKYFVFNENPDKVKIGTSAQQLQKVYPELVAYNEEDDSYAVNYANLSIIALAAIDELYDEIKYLKEEIKSLKDGQC